MQFITNHWKDILAIWGAACGLAAVIVKLTPTPKDDAILASVESWVAKLTGVQRSE